MHIWSAVRGKGFGHGIWHKPRVFPQKQMSTEIWGGWYFGKKLSRLTERAHTISEQLTASDGGALLAIKQGAAWFVMPDQEIPHCLKQEQFTPLGRQALPANERGDQGPNHLTGRAYIAFDGTGGPCQPMPRCSVIWATRPGGSALPLTWTGHGIGWVGPTGNEIWRIWRGELSQRSTGVQYSQHQMGTPCQQSDGERQGYSTRRLSKCLTGVIVNSHRIGNWPEGLS